jgi:hypothetical protein
VQSLVALALLFGTVAQAETVAEAFPPPRGAMLAPDDAFGAWLARRELHPRDHPVRTHAGAPVAPPHAPPASRALVFPLMKGDLQQCADSAYRLRARFLRESGAAEITFHATNGQALPWARWAAGERTRLEGQRLVWVPGRRGADEAAWESWLREVFVYAGTRSLAARDTVPVDWSTGPRAGDVVVAPGSPGHAVVLLDVARRPDGTWLAVVGEGFMPAQDLHVHRGPESGWWVLDPEKGLELPWWPLPAEGLRRWVEP